jgi:UrcA family protein
MKSVVKNAAFAIAICLSGMAGAHAGQAYSSGPQLVVSYGDLDLSRQSGARILLGRLATAASQVCGGVPDSRELARTAMYRTCTRQAMDNAVARVGSPMVISLYGNPYSQFASRR